jgi:hypothetical protein
MVDWWMKRIEKYQFVTMEREMCYIPVRKDRVSKKGKAMLLTGSLIVCCV